jgi:hypothetical protein
MAAIYYEEKEAIQQVKQCQNTGWPKAHKVAQDDGRYVISGHSRDCHCGMCPIIHHDGFMKYEF